MVKRRISPSGTGPAPETSPAPAEEEKPAPDPVKEAPAPAKAPVREKDTPAPAPRTAGNLHTDGLGLAKWQIDMLEKIAGEPGMMQAKKVLNRYKNQNRIKRLGDSSAPNPRPADTFYLVFDASGSPAAFLAPSPSDTHVDMISGASVSLGSFAGNQHLWFQISK